MRKANILIDLMYFLGLVLLVALFYTFVPEANRTPVLWLDFVIVLVIYTGYLGRLMVLFRPLAGFADNVPFFATYWLAWSTYVGFAVTGMVAFYFMKMPFPKQALLQGAIFFVFLFALAFGAWASAWMSRSSARDAVAIGGVRRIQQEAEGVRIAAAELPQQYGIAKTELERIFDDVNCMSGSGSPNALILESEIIEKFKGVRGAILDRAPQEDLSRRCVELRMLVATRKSM